MFGTEFRELQQTQPAIAGRIGPRRRPPSSASTPGS